MQLGVYKPTHPYDYNAIKKLHVGAKKCTDSYDINKTVKIHREAKNVLRTMISTLQ